MKPNLRMKDNAGFCVMDYLERCDHGPVYNRELKALANIESTSSPPPYFPISLIPTDNYEEHFRAWLERNIKYEHITSFDAVGDNPMLAVLKFWKRDTSMEWLFTAVERMIQIGDVIHMRDRDGNTPLAIAAQRGFRTGVTLLIANGAIVHCRNYRGIEVLKQMEQPLATAKMTGDISLWSGIWSCQIALVDAGAIIDPTDQDEWMDAASRRWLVESRSRNLCPLLSSPLGTN